MQYCWGVVEWGCVHVKMRATSIDFQDPECLVIEFEARTSEATVADDSLR